MPGSKRAATGLCVSTSDGGRERTERFGGRKRVLFIDVKLSRASREKNTTTERVHCGRWGGEMDRLKELFLIYFPLM